MVEKVGVAKSRKFAQCGHRNAVLKLSLNFIGVAKPDSTTPIEGF